MAISTNIQLKIGEGPDIEGESMVKGHEKEIDVLSYSWGVSQPSAGASGSGMSASTAQFQSLSIMKYIDKSSPTLMMKCATGTTIGNAVMTVREAAGEEGTYINYLVVTMEPAFVTSYSTSASGSEGDKGTESITLAFRKIKIEYTPQETTAGTPEASIPFSWDVAKQEPAA